MKKFKLINLTAAIVATVLFASGSACAEGKLTNMGVVAGSIRDILPGLRYLDWRFGWQMRTGGRDNWNLPAEQLDLLGTYLMESSSGFCGRFTKEHEEVYVGLDNVSFATRHYQNESTREQGSAVLATFNIYCAYIPK